MKITLATITAFVSLVSSLAIPSAHILEKRNTYTNVTYSGTAFQNSMLSIHNGYRAHHGVGNLTWNSTLALKAYNTSSQCIFRHSSSTPYGENVGAGSSNFNNPTYFVTLWYNEISSYNYSNPGWSTSTGHFSQVIWKGSTQLGCAWVSGCTGYDSPSYPQMVWCEYNPPGNMLPNSNWISNVLRPKASPATPAAPASHT